MPGRTAGRVGVTIVVLTGMALFVTAVFGLVVLGGGVVLHALDRPHLGLSVLATAIVALTVEPVRVSLRNAAARLLGQGSAAPYDRLAAFHPEVVDTDDRKRRHGM